MSCSVHLCSQCRHHCGRRSGNKQIQNEASSCLHQCICCGCKWYREVWSCPIFTHTLPFPLHLQGLIQPLLALIMWSDNCNSFSPYRFCINKDPSIGCIGGTYGLTSNPPSFQQRMYVLDFAGSGVVHMVGMYQKGLNVCQLCVMLANLTSRWPLWTGGLPVCKIPQ